jgi:hypothetical protein
MSNQWAEENLKVIQTLMERSAIYRRALAPIMLLVGIIGLSSGVVGFLFDINTPQKIAILWLGFGFLACVLAFLLIRIQALKDKEPFFTPPAKRVINAIVPGIASGLILLISLLVSSYENKFVFFMFPLLMIFYGLALHSAGFFMRRGIKLFGWVFVIIGCILFMLTGLGMNFSGQKTIHLMVMGGFGVLHILYGIYLFITEKSGAQL